MIEHRPFYKWFYDHVHSYEYDLALKWFLLPFGGESHFRRQMMRPIDFGDGERVLELCCGTGSSSRAIRERGRSIELLAGVDLSIGQLRQAREKLPQTRALLVEANAGETPFPDASFDTVIIPHALHEMPRQTRIAVLQEARRVLRTDGRAVILELDDPPGLLKRLLLGLWLFYWIPYPVNFENPTRRDMVRRGVVNELREAGFAATQKISKFGGTMQVAFGWAKARSAPLAR